MLTSTCAQYFNWHLWLDANHQQRRPHLDVNFQLMVLIKYVSSNISDKHEPLGPNKSRPPSFPFWFHLEMEKYGRIASPGPLVARLQGFGDLLCLVVGAWGYCLADHHTLVQTYEESRVEHLCQSTCRLELEGQLSVIVSQYRRLLSSCAEGPKRSGIPDLVRTRTKVPKMVRNRSGIGH